MFNGSLKAQVQGSCPGFQEVQRRESKVPLEGNSFHGLPLPLEQEARAPAVLQVPELAGARAKPPQGDRLAASARTAQRRLLFSPVSQQKCFCPLASVFLQVFPYEEFSCVFSGQCEEREDSLGAAVLLSPRHGLRKSRSLAL